MVSTRVKFVPLADRIVIRPEGREQTTRGGIHLPDTMKERPQKGEVIAVGPGRVSDNGTRVPMELAVGDQVLYSRYAGTEYKDGEDEYLLMQGSDVLAKLS